MFLRHAMIEKNVVLMVVLTLITVSIGGMVQIIPLFTIESTIERVDGVRPYTPLELLGRNIYVREGCYNCHSQQIRPFQRRGRALRPLQPRRREHVRQAVPVGLQAHRPRPGARRRQILQRLACRPSGRHRAPSCRRCIMPAYPFLAERALDTPTSPSIWALRTVGVPYSDEMIANARADLVRPGRSRRRHHGAAEALSARRRRQGRRRPSRLTEMDALVAYLQMLGTLVRFGDLPPDRPAPIGEDHDRHRSSRRSRWRRSGRMGRAGLRRHRLVGVAAGQPAALRAGRTHPARRRTVRGPTCRPRSRRTQCRARNHRPRMGRHQGAEHATADLVGLHLLRHHRLRHRLLRALSVVAVDKRPHAWLVGLHRPRRAHPGACRAGQGARLVRRSHPRRVARRDRQGSRAAGLRHGRRPLGVPDQLHASAMARAAPAARAFPTWSTTTGCGVAASTRSSRRSRHGIRNSDENSRQSMMPEFGVDGLLTGSRSATSPTMC